MNRTIIITLAVLLSISFTGQPPLSQVTPAQFRVCVYVNSDDTDLDSRLEAFLRRELRALGDVAIVKRDADWHYFWHTVFLKLHARMVLKRVSFQ